MIVSDHGTKLTSNVILGWASDHQVDWHRTRQAMQSGIVESFNGRMGDQLLKPISASSISTKLASSSEPGLPITWHGRIPRGQAVVSAGAFGK